MSNSHSHTRSTVFDAKPALLAQHSIARYFHSKMKLPRKLFETTSDILSIGKSIAIARLELHPKVSTITYSWPQPVLICDGRASMQKVAMIFRAKASVTPSGKRRLQPSIRAVLTMTVPFMIWGLVIIVTNAIATLYCANISAPIALFNMVSFLFDNLLFEVCFSMKYMTHFSDLVFINGVG